MIFLFLVFIALYLSGRILIKKSTIVIGSIGWKNDHSCCRRGKLTPMASKFFRRTPVLYQWLKRRIDGEKKRSFRKVLVGKGFSSLNYFQSRFWKQFSEEVNKLQSQWAMVGLHNHGFEFESLEDGNVPFDILIKNAGDNVFFFQFDITNCLLAGYDPAQIISKNISSISSYHVRIEGKPASSIMKTFSPNMITFL